MLAIETPFPHVGSQCFEKGSGRPVTVLQHRTDGSVFVRRDDVSAPSSFAAGDARGNCTVRFADLAKTRAAAIKPMPRETRKAKRCARK